jgi:hypothetical protein
MSKFIQFFDLKFDLNVFAEWHNAHGVGLVQKLRAPDN